MWLGATGERYACDPCATNGDHFDLVRAVKNCTFPEALDFLRELRERLPANYEPPEFTTGGGASGKPPEPWTDFDRASFGTKLDRARARDVRVLPALLGFPEEMAEWLAAWGLGWEPARIPPGDRPQLRGGRTKVGEQAPLHRSRARPSRRDSIPVSSASRAAVC